MLSRSICPEHLLCTSFPTLLHSLYYYRCLTNIEKISTPLECSPCARHSVGGSSASCNQIIPFSSSCLIVSSFGLTGALASICHMELEYPQVKFLGAWKANVFTLPSYALEFKVQALPSKNEYSIFYR